jgi:hypothetical protein
MILLFVQISAIVSTMQKESETVLQINIKELLQAKVPKIAKWVPPFAINYLSRLIHLDEINEFLKKNYSLEATEFVKACNAYLGFTTELEGGDRLEELLAQRPIIVGNHPLGGSESLAMMEVMNNYGYETKMVSNFIMTYLKPLAPLLIPVLSGKDYKTIKNFRDHFVGDTPIIMFPAGICSRYLSDGTFFDYTWHFTFIKMARRYNRPILPVYIDGANSKKFYRLSKWRNRFKIKTSLEALTLPDEMFKQKGKTIKISIGELISPTEFESSDNNVLWADKVRNHVFLMRQDSHQVFDPAREVTLPAK